MVGGWCRVGEIKMSTDKRFRFFYFLTFSLLCLFSQFFVRMFSVDSHLPLRVVMSLVLGFKWIFSLFFCSLFGCARLISHEIYDFPLELDVVDSRDFSADSRLVNTRQKLSSLPPNHHQFFLLTELCDINVVIRCSQKKRRMTRKINENQLARWMWVVRWVARKKISSLRKLELIFWLFGLFGGFRFFFLCFILIRNKPR